MKYEITYTEELILSDGGWHDFEVYELSYVTEGDVYFRQYEAYFEGILSFENISKIINLYESWIELLENYLNENDLNEFHYVLEDDVLKESSRFTLYKRDSKYPYNIIVPPIRCHTLGGVLFEIKTLVDELKALGGE